MAAFNPAIQYPIFEFNGKTLFLKDAPSKKRKYTNNVDILENFELCGAEDGVYTWIICNDEGSANGSTYPLLYLTQVQNIHEIGTKHMNIVNQKCQGKDIKYAGELIKIGNTLRINLLSGTYMAGIINASNIPSNIESDLIGIFKNIIDRECTGEVEAIIIENTTESYITKNMTMKIDQLIKLINYDYQVYEFPNRLEANKYKRAPVELIKLQRRLPMYQSQKNEKLIEQTKNKIEEYEELLKLKPLSKEILEEMQFNELLINLKSQVVGGAAINVDEEQLKNNGNGNGKGRNNKTSKINLKSKSIKFKQSSNKYSRKIIQNNLAKRGLNKSAINLIGNFVRNNANHSPSPFPQLPPRRPLKRSKTNKLSSLLKHNRNNINGTRKRKFLELTCPNSNLCLTFNEYYQSMLKDYFKNFLGFHYLDEAIVLSKGSVNGMTTLLKYDRKGYKSDVIMKNIKDEVSFSGADSLMYEAFVGLNCVNEYNKLYPVFVETYGTGFLKNDEVHRNLIRARPNSRIEINKNMFYILNHNKRGINLTKFLSQYITEQTNKQVLFVQTVANGITLKEFIDEINKNFQRIITDYQYSSRNSENLINKSKEVFVLLYELCIILYQIYHALYNLNNKFAHNDLHWGNVLIYKLPKNKNDKQLSIQYNYKGIKDGKKIPIANIKTSCIAKIIDYGRCYTKDSKKFINTALSDSYKYAKIEFYAKHKSDAENIVNLIEYKLEQLNLPFDIMSSIQYVAGHNSKYKFFYYIKFNGDNQDFLTNMQNLQQEYHSYDINYHKNNLEYAVIDIVSYRYKITGIQFNVKYVYSVIDKKPINLKIYNEMKKLLGLWDYEQVNENNWFISTTIYNGTKDLWCLGLVQKSLMRMQHDYYLTVMTDKDGSVRSNQDNVYLIIHNLFYDLLEYEVCFDIAKTGSDYKYYSGKQRRKINNVHDAFEILSDIINNEDYTYYYNQYTNGKTETYANIDVFESRTPMKVTIAS